MTHPARSSAALVAAIVLLWLRTAHADDAAPPAALPSVSMSVPTSPGAAHDHFVRGEIELAAGRYAAALVEYRAAYAASAEPGLLFNIAQCHRALGQYQAAVDNLRAYLKTRPDEPAEASGRLGAVCVSTTCIEALIVDLERRARDATLVAGPRPLPATASVDARPAAITTAPVRAGSSTPVYRRWWFITGTVAVVAASVATTIILVRDQDPCGGEPLCFGR